MAYLEIDQTLQTQFEAVARQAGCELLHAEFKGGILRLVLDRNLLAALPDRFTETWSKYLPTGQVNAKFTADYDGARWQPRTATVESPAGTTAAGEMGPAKRWPRCFSRR